MNVLEIRTHHIESAKVLSALSREEFARRLISEKYIQEKEHPFVMLVYHYIRLFDNPSQKFRLKIGELDFICKRCPKLKKGDCNLKKQELGGYRGRDSEIIDEYELNINKTYTTKELRGILGF